MKGKIAIVLCLLSVFRSLCFEAPETDGLAERTNAGELTENGRFLKDSLLVMFWNLENFFDWRDDSLSTSESDAEFSSFGLRHWTRKKFYAKCNAIAKSLFWIQDQKGRLPDAMGIAEVENRFVLSRLIDETALRKTDYSIVHFDSPDSRGIDAALLFRSSKLKLMDAKPLNVRNKDRDGPPLVTRDILLATFQTESGDSVAFLVNHHPSKYGDDSQWRREVALKRLSDATDSLQIAGYSNIIAMGDFNDTPESEAFDILEGLVHLGAPLAAKGEGTIRYSGKWELIDTFFVSPALASSPTPPEMEVLHIPFLMTKDNTHSGEKPLRTYSGPRYIGGVSDHCPIVLEIQ